ncbi:DUF2306 domain-containing protein [Amycolatopsis saalfeldensis]|uniref:Predicted membrane protein n=1 Tax=Amycolatopsis saalfeldensis TaxID=394193 RepID=A0A1H8X6Q7_9PSEU|nr:DUF2306 domain-containing protein [Amycolatopsis saalfeldensis]SEP35393.1 Predicted membrane protein [Amycolatopsis saalfeldensis]
MSATVMSPAVRRRWWWFLWGLLALLATGIAAYFVPPYLTGSSAVPIDRAIVGYYASLVVHALPAGLTLIIGPWQFVPRLRARFPKLHRVLGRVYLISVVAASGAAAYASAVTTSGFALQVAFYLLIVAWLYTAAQAYRTIRRREIALHRVWMIRNYALTFAAVTLRVYLMIGMRVLPSSVPFKDIYTAAAWAGLLGNVLIAEYFIIQRTLAPLARRAPRSGSAAGSPVAEPSAAV